MTQTPESRIRTIHAKPVRGDGAFVLYWMTAARRVAWNFAMDRAVEWCRRLGRPLVVLETLEGSRRWSNARHHQFVLEGMLDNARRLRETAVLYYPYVAARPKQVEELLDALARSACVVIADDGPLHEQDLAPDDVCRRWPVAAEAVDSVGLMPMAIAQQAYPSAYTMRRFLQRCLPDHLIQSPKPNPLARLKLPPAGPLPSAIVQRWRPVNELLLDRMPKCSRYGGFDKSVEPVDTVGGSRAGQRLLRLFVRSRLNDYAQHRNHPDENATSQLAPYLHYGHVSPHQIFDAVARHEDWSPERLGHRSAGQREGWWAVSEPAEAFLDQLVTWRELGANFCTHRTDYAAFESLPDWARRTLARHARDRRDEVYSLDQFDHAATHDRLWNAAQTQLVREGRMHNYLRMLWGKKILQWSASPQDALDVMIELNNRYALDGCDPNSYSGIFWVLGRYDRPFGPERAVFGKIRYMSSRNTAKKVRLKRYLEQYTED